MARNVGQVSVGDAQKTAPRESALSDDARGVLGSTFGHIGARTLTFQTPWNIAPRMLAALDELVGAGLLDVREGEEGRFAWTYRSTRPTGEHAKWFRRNIKRLGGLTYTVPDSERRERKPRGWRPARLTDGATSRPPPRSDAVPGST